MRDIIRTNRRFRVYMLASTGALIHGVFKYNCRYNRILDTEQYSLTWGYINIRYNRENKQNIWT